MAKRKLTLTKGDISAIAQGIKPMVKSVVRDTVRDIVEREIEKLAIMTKKGFDDVHDRINGMVTKDEFFGFKKEMYEFKNRTDQSLYELHSDVSHLKTSMSRVETRLEDVENKIDTFGTMWSDHEDRIRTLETKPC